MTANGMPVNPFGREMGLYECAGEIQTLASRAIVLAERLEKEREDARELLMSPLAGIDKHEAREAFHKSAGLILAESAGDYYVACSGPQLHRFIERFGTSYGDTPPSRSTVAKFWGHPIECSPMTRRAVLKGIFSAINTAQRESGDGCSLALDNARNSIEEWCEAYLMTERHITDRIESAARRLHDIGFIARTLGMTSEQGVLSVRDYASYVSPLHIGDIDSLWDM